MSLADTVVRGLPRDNFAVLVAADKTASCACDARTPPLRLPVCLGASTGLPDSVALNSPWMDGRALGFKSPLGARRKPWTSRPGALTSLFVGFLRGGAQRRTATRTGRERQRDPLRPPRRRRRGTGTGKLESHLYFPEESRVVERGHARQHLALQQLEGGAAARRDVRHF